MQRKIPLKKLVVEVRYKPDLSFYEKMDQLGMDLASEFPDWQRSPLTLELRNKKHHRRLFFSHSRSFYEADGADPDTEFQYAGDRLKKASEKLSLSTLQRVGVRQWFAANLEKSFALMVDEIGQRFLGKNDELSNILNDKRDDLAYVVVFETKEGWKYRLQLGPMQKRQWFEMVLHEPSIFEAAEEGSETFDKFQKLLPEQLLYMDIDFYVENQPTNRFVEFLTAVRTRSHDITTSLIDFCKR
jgi:hypothetical protein